MSNYHHSAVYPFTAPMVKPLIKYRWTNGYNKMIGPMTMTAVAILTASVGMEDKGMITPGCLTAS